MSTYIALAHLPTFNFKYSLTRDRVARFLVISISFKFKFKFKLQPRRLWRAGGLRVVPVPAST